jgi:hypothetical protein
MAGLITQIVADLDSVVVWRRNLRTTVSASDTQVLAVGRDDLASAAIGASACKRMQRADDDLPEQQHWVSASFSDRKSCP